MVLWWWACILLQKACADVLVHCIALHCIALAMKIIHDHAQCQAQVQLTDFMVAAYLPLCHQDSIAALTVVLLHIASWMHVHLQCRGPDYLESNLILKWRTFCQAL